LLAPLDLGGASFAFLVHQDKEVVQA
jgi:hypothetical protein